MKADQIIKNAKILTSDIDKPMASALAVKDGKFVYVGDEAGISAYEGEVTDLGGKFIMPGIIDSHVHVTLGAGMWYIDFGLYISCNSKKEALDNMADYIRKNPGLERYKFVLDRNFLYGEQISKDDLDAICPDAELQIQEAQIHSVWVNSRVLKRHGVTDDIQDPVPGLSFYERKDGHITGYIQEGAAEVPYVLDGALEHTDEQIDAALQQWIDFSLKKGVTGVFDAGIPGFDKFHGRVYGRLCELDRQGKLPIYVDGCYVISADWEAESGLEQLKRFRREYNTEHVKVHTMKIFMDGTLKYGTAHMVTPYASTGAIGVSAFTPEELAGLIIKLNEEDLDLHVHTCGEAASRMVLDGVELARKTLGDKYHVRVTAAHLEIQDDADLDRFAKLGVAANYTPWWHAGDTKFMTVLLGAERAAKMYRCKSVWNSGALVTWSSDNVIYGNFSAWNPYLGIEVGMTRWINEKTNHDEHSRTAAEFPPAGEKMSIEEMLIGYTINGAKQLGIEDSKGSITVGKDADFLVFDNDLLTAEHAGISYNEPRDAYYCGKKMK